MKNATLVIIELPLAQLSYILKPNGRCSGLETNWLTTNSRNFDKGKATCNSKQSSGTELMEIIAPETED